MEDITRLELLKQGNPMITDVDTCLKEIADWYVKYRREIREPELETILLKHCESEVEIQKFSKFLETEPGQMRFKTLLKERRTVQLPGEVRLLKPPVERWWNALSSSERYQILKELGDSEARRYMRYEFGWMRSESQNKVRAYYQKLKE